MSLYKTISEAPISSHLPIRGSTLKVIKTQRFTTAAVSQLVVLFSACSALVLEEFVSVLRDLRNRLSYFS